MKNTKKSLLTSALCLLLCMSMLVGTTFAWFTDEVKSGNNIIQAGNLDVELEYAKVVNGQITDWDTVAGKTAIFDPNALWEPGRVEVVYLKVSNLGTLALKYQLGVNVISETPSVNVEDEAFKLSEHLVFKAVEMPDALTTYSDREAVQLAAGTEKGLKSYNGETTELAVGGADYVALIVYMPETVGNEANYKTGAAVPTINLGINLFATQKDAESDSFGPDYDETAPMCNFVVANEAELIAALAEAKTGDVIGINGNVTWATGATHDSTPFGTDATYITLIGLGEDATFTATGSGVGPVGINNGTVVFKNLKIADKSVSYNEGAWELGYLEFRGNTVFENCEIVNAIQMEGENASFKNCSFNSNKDSEYAVWVCSGDATFEGCYFTGSRGIKIHEAYGSEVGKVVINNNEFLNLSKKPGLAIGDLNADTAVVLTNNIFAGTQAGDQNLYSYETDTDVTTFNFTDENNEVFARAATNAAELKNALEKGENVILMDDVNISSSEAGSNGYGATGVSVKGSILDGNGNSLGVNKWGTWDSAINVTGGTIKNLTVNSGMRGIFMGGATADVYIDNVIIDGTIYTFNSDGGNKNYGVYISNSTLNGWTSHSDVHKEVVYTNCSFGEGQGYAFCRPYGPTKFVGCNFSEGYEVDALGAVTFENCTIGGVALTAENLATLVTSNIGNATVK